MINIVDHLASVLEELKGVSTQLKNHAFSAVGSGSVAIAAYNGVQMLINQTKDLFQQLMQEFAGFEGGSFIIYAFETIQAQEAIEIITTSYIAVLGYKVFKAGGRINLDGEAV